MDDNFRRRVERMLDRDEIRELLCETWFYYGDILPSLTTYATIRKQFLGDGPEHRAEEEGIGERVAKCFTKDGVFEYPGGVKLVGHDEIKQYFRVVRKHWTKANGTYYDYKPGEEASDEPISPRKARFLGPMHIELDGDHAKAWVTWSQVTWMSKHSDPMKPDQFSWGALHYNELVRTPDGWRIKYRRNVGLRPQDPDASPERDRPIRVATAAAEAKAAVKTAKANREARDATPGS
jgi:hypothetical protein